MGDLSQHFNASEFACKDCGKSAIKMSLVIGLEELRTLAGDVPILIDDGYRCPEHNKAVGGVSGSQHQLGTAADIRVEGKTLQEMYNLALCVWGFRNGGIGVYDSTPPFIHVDVRGTPARWARVGGKYVGIPESGLVKVS